MNELNFHKKPIEDSNDNKPSFNVYLDQYLVAEVRGLDPKNQTIIPMRELNDYEENKLYEYLTTLS
ncbi:hypothetical protein [Aquibacillus salsiterrae]|uniref:Uncharacterized protein n=1 Tax=Aquibacillus salsiterrae TaxID=2950439 RepID=A0A9X3WH97_9BACI|nr:hypothetical protein [Aquibacillus salsiterrae]MDC3417001.1 hypothetical protein [Aquibacillus salsiterrae]